MSDRIKQLEELGELLTKGEISDKEFQERKSQILGVGDEPENSSDTTAQKSALKNSSKEKIEELDKLFKEGKISSKDHKTQVLELLEYVSEDSWTGKLINRWLKNTVIPGLEIFKNDPTLIRSKKEFQEAMKRFREASKRRDKALAEIEKMKSGNWENRSMGIEENSNELKKFNLHFTEHIPNFLRRLKGDSHSCEDIIRNMYEREKGDYDNYDKNENGDSTPHKLAENGGHLYNLLVKLSEEKKIYRNGDYFFIDKEAIARKIARLKRKKEIQEEKEKKQLQKKIKKTKPKTKPIQKKIKKTKPKTKPIQNNKIDIEKELKKYKRLLDQELITQDDYDLKKKEILGL